MPEIQELDPHEIITEKLRIAREIHSGPFIIEDTSLCIEKLGGLPGPLVKRFEQALGLEGIARLAEGSKVRARTLIGYANKGEVRFYEGILDGTIVLPCGTNGFGWDVIFKPDGLDKTMAELLPGEKNQISMRKQAVNNLLLAHPYLSH